MSKVALCIFPFWTPTLSHLDSTVWLDSTASIIIIIIIN